MKIYAVVGESGSYAEHLKWNVDAWVEKHRAVARVEQLKRLLTQLGWPAYHLGASQATKHVTTIRFRTIIDRLLVAKDGDPKAIWNGGELYINYTVEELKLADIETAMFFKNCSIREAAIHSTIEKEAMSRESNSDGGIAVPEEFRPALIALGGKLGSKDK